MIELSPKIKKIIISLVFLASLSGLIVLPVLAIAQTKAPIVSESKRCEDYKNQFTITGPSGNQTSIIGDTPVYCSLTALAIPFINYALAISGTVTMIFLIIGGFMYVTSAGNEEQSEKGKKILINSVIGLVVIIMAAAIVRIIASTLSL